MGEQKALVVKNAENSIEKGKIAIDKFGGKWYYSNMYRHPYAQLRKTTPRSTAAELRTPPLRGGRI
jgi:hypothetical protein